MTEEFGEEMFKKHYKFMRNLTIVVVVLLSVFATAALVIISKFLKVI